uniref:Uncharacterized protein n=1 Tax=Anguilla anguilla TaxID=7936 RepID=A0A0E9TT97_ANGAN
MRQTSHKYHIDMISAVPIWFISIQ